MLNNVNSTAGLFSSGHCGVIFIWCNFFDHQFQNYTEHLVTSKTQEQELKLPYLFRQFGNLCETCSGSKNSSLKHCIYFQKKIHT